MHSNNLQNCGSAALPVYILDRIVENQSASQLALRCSLLLRKKQQPNREASHRRLEMNAVSNRSLSLSPPRRCTSKSPRTPGAQKNRRTISINPNPQPPKTASDPETRPKDQSTDEPNMAPVPLQTQLAPKLAKLQNILIVLQELDDLPNSLAIEDEEDQILLGYALLATLYYLVLALLFVGCLWALVMLGFAIYRRFVRERRELKRVGKDGGRLGVWPGVKGIILGVHASGGGLWGDGVMG
jgi:hypothetical protein